MTPFEDALHVSIWALDLAKQLPNLSPTETELINDAMDEIDKYLGLI